MKGLEASPMPVPLMARLFRERPVLTTGLAVLSVGIARRAARELFRKREGGVDGRTVRMVERLLERTLLRAA